MSIENPDTVDIIGTERSTGKVVLTISDHLDWSDAAVHLRLLQDKLNRYLAFVESGEILEQYPQAKGRPVVFHIAFKHRPNDAGRSFLCSAKQTVESAGFELTDEVFVAARFN